MPVPGEKRRNLQSSAVGRPLMREEFYTYGTINDRFDFCRRSAPNIVISLRKPRGGGKMEWDPETVTSNDTEGKRLEVNRQEEQKKR